MHSYGYEEISGRTYVHDNRSVIEVHKVMGRDLLDSVYHKCLKEEFTHRKINFSTEMNGQWNTRAKRWTLISDVIFLLSSALLWN
jgi:hypothetical protein